MRHVCETKSSYSLFKENKVSGSFQTVLQLRVELVLSILNKNWAEPQGPRLAKSKSSMSMRSLGLLWKACHFDWLMAR